MGSLLTAIIGWALLLCAPLSAANRHEHLHALLDFKSLERGYEEWARREDAPKQVGELPLSQFTRDPAEAIRQIFGEEVLTRVETALGGSPNVKAQGMTLAQFSTVIANANSESIGEALRAEALRFPGAPPSRFSPEERRKRRVLSSWFEMGPLTRKDPGSYQAMETFRRNFLEAHLERHGVDKFGDFWGRALRFQWRSDLQDSRSITDLSVPKTLFRKEIFFASTNAVDSRFSFMLSIPRNQLLSLSDKELDAEIAEVKKAMAEGWATGIDVTGSIQEAGEAALEPALLKEKIAAAEIRIKKLEGEADRADAAAKKRSEPTPSEEALRLRAEAKELRTGLKAVRDDLTKAETRVKKLSARLARVLAAMGEVNGEVRLHAFEGARTGMFYPALRNAIESTAKLPRLRIGHIAAMETPDFEWLESLAKRLPPGQLLVEANPYSNHVLHRTSWDRIIATLTELNRRKIPTVIGADEEGILGGHAHLIAVIGELRKRGMPEELLVTLASDSVERKDPNARRAEDVVLHSPVHKCDWITLGKHHIFMTGPYPMRVIPGLGRGLK